MLVISMQYGIRIKSMVCCGAVCCGAVCCGMVCCGTVCCGAVCCGAVCCGVVQFFTFVIWKYENCLQNLSRKFLTKKPDLFLECGNSTAIES